MKVLCGRCSRWLIVALFLSGLSLAGCTRESPPPQQKPAEAPATPPAAQPAQPGEPALPQAPPASPPSDPRRPNVPIIKPPSAGRSRGAQVSKTFAIYVLSRGSGVPAAARVAQEQVQKLVEGDRERGVSVTVETKRIGIEGERRLCVTYETSGDAARALERVRAVVEGVDLVRLVEEPCTSSPATSPKKENP
jgi:hypothetical protein